MVPNSWSERRLEEVASLRRGISWSKDEEVEPPEGEPVLSIPNIQPDGLDLSVLRHIQINSERAAKYRAEPGWLIMVGSNGNPDRIGDCVPVPADRSLLFASFLLGLKPEVSVVTPSFLRWAVQGPILQRQIRGEVQGSTGLQNLSLRTISSYRIPVPPFPEQRKIAAVLSSVDDAIAATRKVIEQTKRVKQGLLQRLMTRGIGHTRFKKTEIGEIPGAWEVKPALEVAHGGKAGIAGGPFGSDLTSKDYIDRPGVPVIRGTNLNYEDGTFRLDDFVFVSEEKADQLARNLAFPGDLIVTQRGTLGQVGLIPTESPFDRYVVSQSQMKLTPDRGMIHPRFLWYYATSETVLNWIKSHTIATGVPHINLGLFRRLPVPVVPLEEQTKILAPLDALQDRIDAGVAEEESIHRLKRGLMQDLLTGRVRVKPD